MNHKQIKHLPAFVVHVKGHQEREKHIRAELEKHGLTFSLMLEGNMSDITPEILDRYFTGEKIHHLSPGTSCTLKHLYIYEEIIKQRLPWALVFEDDIILSDNFNIVMEAVYKELESLPSEEPILVSLENCGLKFVPANELVSGKHLYEKEKGRCAGAILMNQKAAQVIINYAIESKITEIIDNQHNILLKQGLIKMYWCHPTIAEQGSHNGQMVSMLGPKRIGLVYQIGWNIRKRIRQLFA